MEVNKFETWKIEKSTSKKLSQSSGALHNKSSFVLYQNWPDFRFAWLQCVADSYGTDQKGRYRCLCREGYFHPGANASWKGFHGQDVETGIVDSPRFVHLSILVVVVLHCVRLLYSIGLLLRTRSFGKRLVYRI